MIDQYAKCLILVILVGWLIGGRECAAATPFTPRHADPVQEFWRWRAFPELKGQGLSCLAQDRDGNFLFGTDNGIHRYDGTSWRVFPFDEGIVGTRINTLYVAQDGSIYVGSVGASVDSRTGHGNGSFHHKGITDGSPMT